MSPELKEILNGIIAMARHNMAMHGQLMPVTFVISGKKEEKQSIEIIGTPWHDDVEKEAAIIFLRGRAREKQAHTVIMLFEVWYVSLGGPTLASWDGVPARLRRDRKEAVGLYIETLDGSWHGKADIIRDAKGKPSFGEVEYQPIGVRDPIERIQSILA